MVVGLEELGPQGAGSPPLVDQRDVLALGEVAIVVAESHKQLKKREYGERADKCIPLNVCE